MGTRGVRGAVALTVVVLVTGCGRPASVVGSPAAPRPLATVAATPESTPAAAPATAAPAPDAPAPVTDGSAEPVPPKATDSWTVGAKPLPKRPDGFGEIEPTPKVLRNRSLRTVDRLPPPKDGRWASSIAPIDKALRSRMGKSYAKGCPVPLTELRYLTVSFRGFDAKAHTGEIIVNRRVAADVVGVFRRLFEADFPIEEMHIVTSADLTGPPTGDGNNTDAFVCRVARQQTNWSAHAYGLAIDLNPFDNPYTRGDLVLPELASSYLDRSWKRAGMVYPGNVAGKAFAAIGWTWGGSWQRTKDRMHFSETGR
jgi:hypothetical protein